MPDCPREEQLREVLGGGMDLDVQEELTRHLDDCGECRSRLEKLAGGLPWLEMADASEPDCRGLSGAGLRQLCNRPEGSGWPVVGAEAAEGGKMVTALPCRLGPYELIEELGRGGMGIVFKANEQRRNRMVALKLLQSGEIASFSARQRFQNEAQAVGQLDHPNIVPLHEFGRHGPLLYLSMHLVEGTTLAALSRSCPNRNPAWLRRSVVWIIAIARAVHYAHQRGILHRDIKPGNILVDTQGWPYLTDFGLAKCVQRPSSITGSHCSLGTPQYASPEQLDGDVRPVTTASDVYGLGAVLYELLTGRPPFEGGNAVATARQVLDSEPRSPRLLNSRVDRDLATVCLTCLRKEPARRYGSAEALAADLERWLGQEPIHAQSLKPVDQVVYFARRRPAVSLLAGLLALELGIFAALLLHSNRSLRCAIKSAAEARESEKVARQTELLTLHNGLIQQASAIRRSHAIGRRFEAVHFLQRAGDLMGSDRLVSEMAAALANFDLREVWRHPLPPCVMSDTIRHRFLTLDAQLRSVIAHDPAEGLILQTLGWSGRSRRFDGTTDAVAPWVVMSPDGAWFVCQRQEMLELWKTEAEKPERQWRLQPVEGVRVPGRIEPVAFANDSCRLAVPAEEGGVRLITLTDPLDEVVFAGQTSASLIAFDPRGRRLAVAHGREVDILDTDTGRRLGALTTGGGIQWFEWSPAGEDLALASRNCTHVELRNVASGQLSASIGLATPVNRMAFHPSARILAVATEDSRVSLWDVPGARMILDLEGRSRVLQFSADGARLAVAGALDEIICYEMVRPTVHREFRRQSGLHSESAYTLDVSRDGRWVVTADAAGLRFWDVDRGIEVGQVEQPSPVWTHVRFADDETVLLVNPVHQGGFRYNFPQPGSGLAEGIHLGEPETWFDEPDHACWGQCAAHALMLAPRQEAVQLWMNGDPKQRRLVARLRKDGTTVPSLSRDGRLLALTHSPGGLLEIWSLEETRCIETLSNAFYTAATFTPDNRYLVAARRDAIEVWDVRAWERVLTLADGLNRGEFECLRFSPDGSLLLVQSSPNTHQLYAYPGWSKVIELTSPEVLARHECEWSHDGCRLYTLDRGNRLYEWNLPVLATELANLGLVIPGLPSDSTRSPQPGASAKGFQARIQH